MSVSVTGQIKNDANLSRMLVAAVWVENPIKEEALPHVINSPVLDKTRPPPAGWPRSRALLPREREAPRGCAGDGILPLPLSV